MAQDRLKVNERTISNGILGAAWVAQWFSTAFGPGCDTGDPGSSPTLGSLHGACFSPCPSLCVSHE